MTEVIEPAGIDGFAGDFVEDGDEVVERANGRQRGGTGGAAKVSEEQGGFDLLEGDAAGVERDGELTVEARRTTGCHIGQPEIKRKNARDEVDQDLGGFGGLGEWPRVAASISLSRWR